MDQRLQKSVADLFDEAICGEPAAVPRVQIEIGFATWRTIPLEWNTAMRLAELSGMRVRIVYADGEQRKVFDPNKPIAPEAA